jgi:hypothetical protein
MKQLNLLVAVMALTVMAFLPAAARADDALEGLDVTVFVLDDVRDLDEAMHDMDGPDDGDVHRDDWEDDGRDEDESDNRGSGEVGTDDPVQAEGESGGDFADEEWGDGFAHDADDEDQMEHEDDFEDGEDIDFDEFHDDAVEEDDQMDDSLDD